MAEDAKQPDGEKVTTPIDDREDRHDEFTSDSKKCPECGEPIENVRATCPNCGYEYSDKDYDDGEAGQEFVAGAQVDDDGNEIIDEQVEEEADGDDQDEDTSSSTSSGTSEGTSDPGDAQA